MYLYPLSIPLSAGLRMPFLGMISPASWDRTDFINRVEFTKLVPYGASYYSSNQASFQESDPFQWEKCSSQVNGAWTSQSHTPINLSQKSIVQVSASDSTQQTPRCTTLHQSSQPFHTHLKHSATLWPKEDSSHTELCSWICYLRQAEKTLPLFQIPQQGQKSFTVSCF